MRTNEKSEGLPAMQQVKSHGRRCGASRTRRGLCMWIWIPPWPVSLRARSVKYLAIIHLWNRNDLAFVSQGSTTRNILWAVPL